MAADSWKQLLLALGLALVFVMLGLGVWAFTLTPEAFKIVQPQYQAVVLDTFLPLVKLSGAAVVTYVVGVSIANAIRMKK